MMDKKETEDFNELVDDLKFEIVYALGFIWLINRIPFLKLKKQYQERLDDKFKNLK